MTGGGDHRALVGDVAEVGGRAVLDDRQNHTVSGVVWRDIPPCGHGFCRPDVGYFAERRALIEHPIVSTAGPGLRRVVVLVRRSIRDPQ